MCLNSRKQFYHLILSTVISRGLTLLLEIVLFLVLPNDNDKRLLQSDHVESGDDDFLKLTASHKSQNQKINFIKILHAIVTGNKHSDVIKFTDNKIVIVDVPELEEMLPSHFENSDFKNFIRNIRNHSFHSLDGCVAFQSSYVENHRPHCAAKGGQLTVGLRAPLSF